MQDYTANQHLADIKLLAVDMDLTLLADDKSQPEGMPELIDELLGAGVMFCPASGRPTPTLKSMFPEHKDDIAFLGDNGANTVYKTHQVFKSIIDSALWHECLAFAVTQPGCVPVLNGLEEGFLGVRGANVPSKMFPFIIATTGAIAYYCTEFLHTLLSGTIGFGMVISLIVNLIVFYLAVTIYNDSRA